jgi:pilus assembly protein CpaE
MKTLTVGILASDSEQRALLQEQASAAGMFRSVHQGGSYPAASSDSAMRQLALASPEVILMDIPGGDPTPALRAIELLKRELPETAVFVVGRMDKPQVIVTAMRAGASEYLERPISTAHLLEAYSRLCATRNGRDSSSRGKVVTVVNAKGGSGATTVAVNTALALGSAHGRVALVDLAGMGHASLHLSVKPSFTIVDALKNLHRIDQSLLEGFMTECHSGVRLLAAPPKPYAEPSAEDLARLLDLMVSHYSYTVIDLSSRMDLAMRAVCNFSDHVLMVSQLDMASLWSASQMQGFLSETAGAEKVRLVLNRYHKVPGVTDDDVEAATRCRILWKLQNQYQTVSGSIESGIPVSQQNSSEIAKSFLGLASRLTGYDLSSKTAQKSREPQRRGLLERLMGRPMATATSVNR